MITTPRVVGSLALSAAALAGLQRPAEPPRLDATLVAVSARGVRPVRAHLTLVVSPGWHIAAEPPGTSGLATRVTWQLPPGWRLVHARWPAPTRSIDGRDTLYTYEGRTVVDVTFDAPAAVRAGAIRGVISFGLCRDICIPGRETVTLTP